MTFWAIIVTTQWVQQVFMLFLKICDFHPCPSRRLSLIFFFTKIQKIFVSRSPSIEELEELSPEYLEIVNFVNLGWSSVKNELEQGDFVEDNSEDGCKNYSLR